MRPDSKRPLALRVGGNVNAPVIEHRLEPDFSRCLGPCDGVEMVEVLVRSDGAVGDVYIPMPINTCIDDSVRSALRQWRFQPATLHGGPVDVLFNVTVRINFA